MVDPFTREYRESTLRDLYDIARLVDALEHIHFLQRPIVCRDMTDPADLDFNTCYAAIAGTRKHVGTSWVDPAHLATSLEMLHQVAGSEKAWRERPFVSMSSCFVVPPLRFAEDACRCLEAAVLGGMHASLLGCCMESFVLDNDMLGAINRTVRGIEVNDETLSIEAMREVCIGGPQHFLGHDQTLSLMQRDYVYPQVGDRLSPKEWVEQGSRIALERARDKAQEILASHHPRYIAKDLDDDLRARFDVKLERGGMGASDTSPPDP